VAPASILCIGSERNRACSLVQKSALRSPRPDARLVFGSQEIFCLPAGHVTTFASQSIANALLSKPALSRDCQLGSRATGPMISTP
jgi:hypothetical protein